MSKLPDGPGYVVVHHGPIKVGDAVLVARIDDEHRQIESGYERLSFVPTIKNNLVRDIDKAWADAIAASLTPHAE